MRADLDAQLVKDHPVLFSDRYTDMRSTAMCWGFECGDGWYDLIKEAADKLEPLCARILRDYRRREKPWYRYVRLPLVWSARFPVRFVSHRLHSALYALVDKLVPGVNRSPLYFYGGPPRASQVKEKFGTLRFYMTHSSDDMESIIRVAERRSAVTCETCGGKGKFRGKHWFYVSCNKHVRKS